MQQKEDIDKLGVIALELGLMHQFDAQKLVDETGITTQLYFANKLLHVVPIKFMSCYAQCSKENSLDNIDLTRTLSIQEMENWANQCYKSHPLYKTFMENKYATLLNDSPALRYLMKQSCERRLFTTALFLSRRDIAGLENFCRKETYAPSIIQFALALKSYNPQEAYDILCNYSCNSAVVVYHLGTFFADKNEMLGRYRHAAKHGVTYALEQMALHIAQKPLEQAKREIQQLYMNYMDKTDAVSQFFLYKYCRPNELELLQSAAAQGYMMAQFHLGSLYEQGDVQKRIRKNKFIAMDYFKRAASQGCSGSAAKLINDWILSSKNINERFDCFGHQINPYMFACALNVPTEMIYKVYERIVKHYVKGGRKCLDSKQPIGDLIGTFSNCCYGDIVKFKPIPTNNSCVIPELEQCSMTGGRLIWNSKDVVRAFREATCKYPFDQNGFYSKIGKVDRPPRKFNSEEQGLRLLKQIATLLYFAEKPKKKANQTVLSRKLTEVQCMHLVVNKVDYLFVACNGGDEWSVTTVLETWENFDEHLKSFKPKIEKNNEKHKRAKRYNSIIQNVSELSLPSSQLDCYTRIVTLLQSKLNETCYDVANEQLLLKDSAVYFLYSTNENEIGRHAEEYLVDIWNQYKNSPNAHCCIAGKKRPCFSCFSTMERAEVSNFNTRPGNAWINALLQQTQEDANRTVLNLLKLPSHITKDSENKDISDFDSGSEEDKPISQVMRGKRPLN